MQNCKIAARDEFSPPLIPQQEKVRSITQMSLLGLRHRITRLPGKTGRCLEVSRKPQNVAWPLCFDSITAGNTQICAQAQASVTIALNLFGCRPTNKTGTEMSEPLSDLEVLKQVASGDKRGLETLYSRHSDRTFKFLVRLTANKSAAEDLTHDVFLEIWKNAKRFEGRSSVATWILSIARYKALDARRKQRTLTEDDLPARAEPTPEMNVMQASSSDTMRECLAALSEEHREVIDLVYYHEKIRERGQRDPRHPRGDGQDAHVLRPEETQRDASSPGGRERCLQLWEIRASPGT